MPPETSTIIEFSVECDEYSVGPNLNRSNGVCQTLLYTFLNKKKCGKRKKNPQQCLSFGHRGGCNVDSQIVLYTNQHRKLMNY